MAGCVPARGVTRAFLREADMMTRREGGSGSGVVRGGGRRRGGFTLVDVLVVVVIMGIAAAVVVPQMLDTGTLTIQGAARRLVSDLLIAQNESIARALRYRVDFDLDNNSYRIYAITGEALEVAGVGGDYIVDFDEDSRWEGITIVEASLGGDAIISYDELGTPSSGGFIDMTTGDVTYRISIAPFTGRVTVEPLAVGP